MIFKCNISNLLVCSTIVHMRLYQLTVYCVVFKVAVPFIEI